MITNREIIDARIHTYLKHKFAPDYKVLGIRTRWVGQWKGENFYTVRYFLTSKRFIGVAHATTKSEFVTRKFG